MEPEPRRGTSSGEANKAYSLVAIPAQPFDKYTLIGKLGHGGMAEVNLGVAGGRGGFRKLTVIKRLHGHLAMEPDFVDMFLDEARLAAKLNHPHCVQTHEVGEYEGSHFLAMEYLDGQGLERLLRMSGQLDRPIPWEVAARIVSDALDGLAYAHELTDYDGSPLGVVHRDISPQNIFITYTGMVKLLDFGIAKAATHVVETKTGVIKGKYAYMAPEQALGTPIDHRADLWSMGVVLWEVLTGRRLFKSANELATLHETLQGEIKLPSAFRPGLPTDLDTICMRALQRSPDQRYQTAQEMKDDLDRYLNGLPKTPGRKHISRLMKDRFGEVIEVHQTTLAHCLEGSGAAVITASSLHRLVEASSVASSVSGVRTSDGFTPTPTPPPLLAQAPPGSSPSIETSLRELEREESGGWFWKVAVVLVVVLLAVIIALLLPIGRDDDGGAVADGTIDLRDPSPIVVVHPESPGENTAARAGEHDPEATGPEATDPAATDPAAADPAATDPEATDPAATDPEATDPEATDPEAADPEATDPEATDPDASDTLEPGQAEAPLSRSELARRRRLAERRRRQQQPQGQNPPPSEPAPAASQEPGFLTLATTPWTNVSVGGRDLGTTPLIRVSLPPGRHNLRLVNAEQGINESYSVTIASGQTVSRRLGLR